MSKPCKLCPFRTDIPAYLRHARARQIASDLRNDGFFPCHETVDYSAGDGDGRVTERSKWCSGAAIVMLKEEILGANQMARISMRLGDLDPDTLDRTAPVPDSLLAWIRRHRTPVT